jgi:hypothetical protein
MDNLQTTQSISRGRRKIEIEGCFVCPDYGMSA